jgi:Domain of unknown function (DUF1929)
MPWSSIISTDGVIAIHAILRPGGEEFENGQDGDGIICLWGGDNHDKASHDSQHWDHAAKFNCRLTNEPLRRLHTPSWDIFCCGHTVLGNGDLLVAGGTESFPTENPGEHHEHFTGLRSTARYSAGDYFETLADMSYEPNRSPHGGGRWYPTLITLADGRAYAFAGHPAQDDTRHSNSTPEIFDYIDNRWIQVAQVGINPDNPVLYPRLHLMNTGQIFCSSAIPAFNSCISIDPYTSQVTEAANLPHPAYQGFDYPSVLLPLLPGDGYSPRFLLCGTTPSQTLEVGDRPPIWQTIPRDSQMENIARVHSNATLLPDGNVVLTGGADQSTDQVSTGSKPEIFVPFIAKEGPIYAYAPGGGVWRTLDDPATLLRNYHSTALLMPDGRVWTAGGNAPGQPTVDGAVDAFVQMQIEIYSPPYPGGIRPKITFCDASIQYQQTFKVVVAGPATDIELVVLMRCGSSTHAFNGGQRAVWTNFTADEQSGELTVTAPPNGNVAPAGFWMVFVLDAQRRPCEYAKFVYLF